MTLLVLAPSQHLPPIPLLLSIPEVMQQLEKRQQVFMGQHDVIIVMTEKEGGRAHFSKSQAKSHDI